MSRSEGGQKGSPRFVGSPPPFEFITSDAALIAALPALQTAPVLGFDIETIGVNPWGGSMRLIQLATPECVYLFDSQAVDVSLLEPIFATGTSTLVGHNLVFELGFIAAAGLSIPAGIRLFDTQLACQILTAGVTGVDKIPGLAAVAKRILGITIDKTQQASDWSGRLSDEQLAYAARDADVLLPLHEALAAELTRARLGAIAALEFRALPAMAWLDRSGVLIDTAAWTDLAESAADELHTIEADLTALVPGFNPRSHKQITQVLADREIIVPNTAAETLRVAQSRLEVPDPVIALILRHRVVSTRVSSYGTKFLEHIDAATGRIHATYWQIGAASGRMACSTPPLQSTPHLDDYRGCFRPGPGRVFVKADYAQIELRIAAQLTKDQALRKAFRAGEDLHIATARAVLGREPEGNDRQLAKALNFGLLYGMGADRLRSYARDQYGVELTPADARRFRGRFFQTYRGLHLWHQSQGEGTTTTRTFLGRTRQRVTRFSEKLNSPVQGTGADILKLALARLWEDRAAVPSAVPVLAVHDEIVMEVEMEEAAACKEWLQRHMETAGTEMLTDVPVVVDAAIVADWSGAPVELPVGPATLRGSRESSPKG